MIRVLIVDADERRRAVLIEGAEGSAGVEVVGIVGDGRMACSAAVALNPDVVLVADQLPTMSGEDVAAWLGTEAPAVRIVAVGCRTDASRRAMLAAGAVATVPDGAGAAEVAAAVLGAVAST